MFRPLALYIGLRYTRAKRRTHFISFISFASMIGIALGVTVLITVLSVMNGFDYQIRTRMFAMARQVSIKDVDGRLQNWQDLAKKTEHIKDVIAAAPFVDARGMLTHKGMVNTVIVTGIKPKYEEQVTELRDKVVKGVLDSLKPGSFNIAIGDRLAGLLGVSVGDKVTLVTPQAAVTAIGVVPRFKRFTVGAIFHVGGNFGYDQAFAFVDLSDAQVLYKMGNTVTGVRLKLNNLYDAPHVTDALMKSLPPSYEVSNWTDDFGAFFSAIKMEKTMMFVILTLIIAVAAFNLVSSLVMAVNDKQSEIAILRTIGSTPRSVMGIFIVQGMLVGLIGTVLGLLGGVALATHITSLVSDIERIFSVQFISSSVYFIDFLPSKLVWSDVWHICLIALGLSLLATLYPAWRASRTQPAEALRYD